VINVNDGADLVEEEKLTSLLASSRLQWLRYLPFRETHKESLINLSLLISDPAIKGVGEILVEYDS
jgi:hypothetical protein